jgi:hypothetical protein
MLSSGLRTRIRLNETEKRMVRIGSHLPICATRAGPSLASGSFKLTMFPSFTVVLLLRICPHQTEISIVEKIDELCTRSQAYQPVEEVNLVDVFQCLSDNVFALRQIQFLNFLPVLEVSTLELGSVRDVGETVLV